MAKNKLILKSSIGLTYLAFLSTTDLADRPELCIGWGSLILEIIG